MAYIFETPWPTELCVPILKALITLVDILVVQKHNSILEACFLLSNDIYLDSIYVVEGSLFSFATVSNAAARYVLYSLGLAEWVTDDTGGYLYLVPGLLGCSFKQL